MPNQSAGANFTGNPLNPFKHPQQTAAELAAIAKRNIALDKREREEQAKALRQAQGLHENTPMPTTGALLRTIPRLPSQETIGAQMDYAGNAAVKGKKYASEKLANAGAKFGELITEILERATTVYGDDRNIIFSVISTIMDAVNNSVMGGLTGLESELEKIVNEEKAKGSGKPNAALDFLADCANFIRFFLEYLYYNKKLKIDKHLIEKMAEAKAELKEAQEAKREVAASSTLAGAARKRKEEADKKLQYLLKRQNEANNKASLDATGGDDVLKRQNKRIEYLNNAFKHLVFTYGQLSGRTIYNIIQFLKNGPPPKVGYFDPISFGSLTNTMIRASPPGAIAGQIMDSVVDFGKAFINAGEASYVSLEKERELANEYMAYITEDTNNQISGQSGGKPEPSVEPKKIDRDTFVKYYDSVKADKKDKKGKDKNYEERIKKLTRNKGRTNTNHNISQLTTGNIEKRIEDVTNAMAEFNHVNNLKALLELILANISRIYRKKSIYIDSTNNSKDKSKIPLLTRDEVKKMREDDKVVTVFNKIINEFNTAIKSSNTATVDKLTIKKSNPELYGIIMNFIRNNYKSAEDQVEELTKKIDEANEDRATQVPMKQQRAFFLDVVVKEQELAVALAAEAEAEAKAEAEANAKVEGEVEGEAKATDDSVKVVKATKAAVDAKRELRRIINMQNKLMPKDQTDDTSSKGIDDAKTELIAAKQRALDNAGSMKIDNDINELLLKLLALMEEPYDVVGLPENQEGRVIKNGWKNNILLALKIVASKKLALASEKLALASEKLALASEKLASKKGVITVEAQTNQSKVNPPMKASNETVEIDKNLRMKNADIIDGENTDGENNKDKKKLAYITSEIAKLTERVNAENTHIKGLGERMKQKSVPVRGRGKSKPKEGKAFLEEEYKSLIDQLNNVKEAERGELNREIHNSGDFGRLASTYVNLKRGMADDIDGLIKTVKANGIQEEDQENLELVKSGLKKMLRFISNREFGSINALFKRQKKKKTRRGQGGGDLSNIRRHIAKATRRIETTLSNFNNTRRNKRIKSKPRKTRRVNYGH